MIDPSDPEYKATKRLKQGRVTLPTKLVAFAEWVANRFDCSVPLNIVADRTFLGDPRLQIIFEFEADQEKFHSNDGNYDSSKQTIVLDRYMEMFPPNGFSRRAHDRLFVIFVDFESVARKEANNAMSGKQIARVQHSLASPLIWAIKPMFDSVTFMLHTDYQLEETEGTTFRKQCIEAYSRELASHDEFGYYARQPIHALFSSKETFERDYNGSWFRFFK